MKILQINCVYANGSTGKIVYALYDYAKRQGDRPYVIYGIGKKSTDANVYRVTPWAIRKAQSFWSRITGYPYGGAYWGTAAALNLIKKIKPDIVHVQCANGYMVNIYRILNYLKEHKIPTVITNHAEFMYTGGCTYTVDCDKWMTGCHDCPKIGKEHPISYFFDRTRQEWNLLRKSYSGFKYLYICCVSDWLRDRARRSPFYKGYKVETVFNGLDAETFKFRPDEELRKKILSNYKKIVIHVTPGFYSNIKGGPHVVEMAKRLPDVCFLIVGSENNGTIHQENIKFAGRVEDQKKLAHLYSIADACLLTSLRETFSMVTAESLCCGTPVVGFKAGGPEMIALKDYSEFVDQGKDDALEASLKRMLDRKIDKKALSDTARPRYSDQTMCEKYYQVYKELIQEKENNAK